MYVYFGRLHAALHDFSEFFPPTTNVNKELENQNTFFMTLGLYGLRQEYAATCDQILKSLVNPTMNDFLVICTPYSLENKHRDTITCCSHTTS